MPFNEQKDSLQAHFETRILTFLSTCSNVLLYPRILAP